MSGERVEAQFTLPSGTAFSASNGNGAAAAVITPTPGAYYPTTLLTEIQTQLNNNVQGYSATAAALAEAVGFGAYSAAWLFNIASGSDTGAFGGITLTPSGSPLYGIAGPRAGVDRAVGFDSATDGFGGGNVLNVTAADDLIVPFVFYSGAGDADVFTKWDGATGWWILQNAAGQIGMYVQQGANIAFPLTAVLPPNQWHAGLAYIDRGGTTLGIIVQSLSTGAVSSGSAGVGAIGNLTNAVNLRVGDNSGYGATNTPDLAFLGIGVAASAARGVHTNRLAAIANFAAAVNSAWSVALSATGQVSIANSGWKTATITKTGGLATTWDGGASSVQTIAGDGFVETTIVETNKERMIGLGAVDSGVSYTDVDYGIDAASDGNLYIYQSGAGAGSFGAYAAGDVIRVERIGTAVTYKKNGATFYTSLIPSSGPLLVDVAMSDLASTLTAIRLVDAGTQVALSWRNIVNVTVSSAWSIAWTSTALRDLLGFTANITGVASTQTGTESASGIWIPGSDLVADSNPKQAPRGDTGSATVAPDGSVYGLPGTFYFRHRNVRFPYVPTQKVWANDATVVGEDWETFYLETQQGQHPWFSPYSRVKVYWDMAGVVTELGYGDVASWKMPNPTKLDELVMPAWPYTGLVEIKLGDLYSNG